MMNEEYAHLFHQFELEFRRNHPDFSNYDAHNIDIQKSK